MPELHTLLSVPSIAPYEKMYPGSLVIFFRPKKQATHGRAEVFKGEIGSTAQSRHKKLDGLPIRHHSVLAGLLSA